jgi:hypothetical protein
MGKLLIAGQVEAGEWAEEAGLGLLGLIWIRPVEASMGLPRLLGSRSLVIRQV